ncbi:hypothetical protein [Virgibacillus salexigens]|uniref:hypothetical protein n=1 Tax=Virgibacillus salexigens TaxID=61016 RepID=UPI00190E221D|nr:hypothetical protein [Virgibacillus salexigens]
MNKKFLRTVLWSLFVSILLLACIWLFFKNMELEDENERYEKYIENIAIQYMEEVDQSVLFLDDIVQEVSKQNSLTQHQKEDLVETFNNFSLHIQDMQELLVETTPIEKEELPIQETVKKAKKYCNHFNRVEMSAKEISFDYMEISTLEEVKDFTEQLSKVATVKEEEKENTWTSTYWKSKLDSYERATYEFKNKYHFLDAGDFWTETNKTCG